MKEEVHFSFFTGNATHMAVPRHKGVRETHLQKREGATGNQMEVT